MRQDLDLQQEQPLTTYGTTQSPKKRIVRLRCPAFTSEEWRAKNPLLQKGEFGVESDTHSVKVGDGVTRWLGLPYTSSAGSMAWGNIGGDINNQLDLTDALSTKANTADVQAMVDEAVGGITFEVFSVGKEGLVPAPTASDATKCLLGDGSWGTPGDIGGGDALPDQTDNAGKFLTTDGENASWSDKPLVNLSNKETSIIIGKKPDDSLWGHDENVALGYNASAKFYSTVVGYAAKSESTQGVAIGYRSTIENGDRSIAIGYNAKTTAKEAYQIGYGTNSERGTLYVGLSADDGATWQNHKLLDKNGTIPAERMSSTVGATGQVLTKTDTGMEWQEPTGGGGGLPDQTDNAGKFLMTDGTTTSWGEALTNLAGNNDSLWLGSGTLGDNLNDAIVLYIGSGFVSAGKRAIAIGTGRATGRYSVCINGFDSAGDYAIQLGGNTASNPDSNTFKVGNENGNFEMMDANGKVPLDRLTYVTDQIGDISTALTSILGE